VESGIERLGLAVENVQLPDDTLRATVKVRNPKGLHMRAAMAFAKLAARYKAAVTVRKRDRMANGKSGMSLMLLPPNLKRNCCWRSKETTRRRHSRF